MNSGPSPIINARKRSQGLKSKYVSMKNPRERMKSNVTILLERKAEAKRGPIPRKARAIYIMCFALPAATIVRGRGGVYMGWARLTK